MVERPLELLQIVEVLAHGIAQRHFVANLDAIREHALRPRQPIRVDGRHLAHRDEARPGGRGAGIDREGALEGRLRLHESSGVGVQFGQEQVRRRQRGFDLKRAPGTGRGLDTAALQTQRAA